ncbi:MAG: hypothetical protein ACRENP_07710 [Longimicrobiales bacterium]
MTNARTVRSRLLYILALAGCTGSGDAASSGERPEYEALARQFGRHVVTGDWAAAYALTTSEFQQAVPREQLRASYDDLVRQMREDEPAFQANTVQPDYGVLPADETEARESYDLVVVPPRNTWKAWMGVQIGSGTGTTVDRGVNAMATHCRAGREARDRSRELRVH